MTTLIDISPLISPRIGVWPGDTPFEREMLMSMEQGQNYDLSTVRTTLHLGAHADAPNHYHAQGMGIGERSLDFYFGPCQVITAEVSQGGRIFPKDLQGEIHSPRVLIKTGTFPDPENWNTDFAACSATLIHDLHYQGCRLVGIDTPSVDPQEDKELESHQAIAEHDMAILEGLVLAEVPDGTYTLCAFPLRLENADASPVRAVLIKN
jgi:arylformamidase